MKVTEKYLERFQIMFKEPGDLFALEAQEIPLSGYEVRSGDFNTATDIPPEDDRAAQLDIIYRDANPDAAEAWEFDPKAARSTFVIPRRDGNDVDTVGYKFDGLLHYRDAARWYRNKFGYET